ncbi:hypothetical protein Btru_016899 [Bulinus truncatus]|nr:hypothetical protein Btru_016899 [Bulinus truncatus]
MSISVSTPAICNNLRRIHCKSTRLTDYLRNQEQLLSALAVYCAKLSELNNARNEFNSDADDEVRRTMDKLVSLLGSTLTAGHTTPQVPVEDPPLSLISTINRIYHVAVKLNQLLHFLQTPSGRHFTGLRCSLMCGRIISSHIGDVYHGRSSYLPHCLPRPGQVDYTDGPPPPQCASPTIRTRDSSISSPFLQMVSDADWGNPRH